VTRPNAPGGGFSSPTSGLPVAICLHCRNQESIRSLAAQKWRSTIAAFALSSEQSARRHNT